MREPPGTLGNIMGLPMLDALPREVCLAVRVERISVMIAAAARKIKVVLFCLVIPSSFPLGTWPSPSLSLLRGNKGYRGPTPLCM